MKAATIFLLCLFASSAFALFPDIFDTDPPNIVKLKQNLQKSNIPKLFENTKNVNEINFKQPSAEKVKATPRDTCPPFWTGEFCEFPVCKETYFLDSDPSAQLTYIDLYYGNSSAYIFVDNTMYGEEFQLISDSMTPSYPTLTLFDDQGLLYTPSKVINSPTSATYTFGFLPVQRYKIVLHSELPGANILTLYNAYTYMTTQIGAISYQFPGNSALHNDNPSYEFPVNGTFVTVLRANNLEYPGTVKTMTVSSDDTFLYNYRLDIRFGCTYLYYTNEFHCNAEGNYYVRIYGVDFYGAKFTRLHSILCQIP